MIGYIDESVRDTAGGLTYVVTTLIVVEDPDGIRAALRAQLLPGQTHLHWRDESKQRRDALLAHLGELPVCAHAAIVREVLPRRQEQARSKALTRLLRATQNDVTEVVIEARSPRLNARDDATIEQARRNGPSTMACATASPASPTSRCCGPQTS